MDDRRFHAELVRCGLHPKARTLGHHLAAIFGRLPCAGRNVLDIGGGAGLLSFCAVQRGAARVVLLEPESAGARSGMLERFQRAEQALDMPGRITRLAVRFQDFDPGGERFDLVLAHNSINHLDEAACIALHRSRPAREGYLRILRRLWAMLNPGAQAIICDCARRNLFADLGLRNPLAPSIEWPKHQSPHAWAGVFAEAGFVRPEIGWRTFNTLGAPGRLLLGNALAAYLTTSNFRLVMSKP